MTISSSISVAANSLSANVLAGEQFEFLPANSTVQVRVSSAAGGGQRVNFNIGGEQILVDALAPATAHYPIAPDDTMVTTSGIKGERLFMTIRNTTGGAIVTSYVVEIMPA